MSDPDREEVLDVARTLGRTADLREARRLAGEITERLDGTKNATAMMALAMAIAVMLRSAAPDPQGGGLGAYDEDVVADALPFLIRVWRDWIDKAIEGSGTGRSVN